MSLTARNRAASRNGRGWEAVLDDVHALYNGSGRASVVRTPPALRILGALPGGHVRACFDGDGPPDYLAQSAGVAFMFDAKSSDDERWALRNVKAHQAERFAAHEKQGGMAFVLLRMECVTWLLPWSALGPLWRSWASGAAARGQASLTMADCDTFGRRVIGANWLPVAMAVRSPGGEA